jgi:hypothetical protein
VSVISHRPDPASYALAYDEARRALEAQERVVAELRSRAGTLIAAAAIATSVLGGRILSGRDVHPLAWIAIGCFVMLGVTLLILLWPWRDWRFTVNAQSFIQTYLEPSDGAPSTSPPSTETSLSIWRTVGRPTASNSVGFKQPSRQPQYCWSVK